MKITKFLSIMVIASGLFSACSDSNDNKSASAGTPAETETAAASNTLSDTDATQSVINNIMTRTSIRKFTDKPVPQDTLDLLVKAGMAAPTAMDKRPWAYVVITDKETLNALDAIKPYFNLKTATAAIVVCGNMDKAIEGEAREYWVQDCSAATENILLAAHAYGLGAVWCGVYPGHELVGEVSKVLELPENIIPLNVITLGYPDQNPEPKDKYNPEDIHYQKW